MLRSIDKQSGESVESVLKKKRKAMVGRICRKGRFKPGMMRLGVEWVCVNVVCGRHDLAELLIRLKQFDKAEKLLKMFIDQEQKGLYSLPTGIVLTLNIFRCCTLFHIVVISVIFR